MNPNRGLRNFIYRFFSDSPNSVFNTWGSYGSGTRPGG